MPVLLQLPSGIVVVLDVGKLQQLLPSTCMDLRPAPLTAPLGFGGAVPWSGRVCAGTFT